MSIDVPQIQNKVNTIKWLCDAGNAGNPVQVK
jgi:hypothetical protein